ncbi:MAG: MOSC domain-containing protein [Chloroflexi bacterium]|nr:MOSC domain-containing protein [Chloroflexota bacterium]
MRLLSVNVSQPIAVEIGEQRYHTGIYKSAVAGRLWLGRAQLAGDGQADMENHGGPNRAVYCYPHEHYAYWSGQLARDDFEYGQFGENLTTQGLLENKVCVGDAFQVGEAIIQVTQPRVPCYKLANKLGIPTFAKTFLQANRSGFYARVLEEGSVGAGDVILPVEKDPVGMTVAEVNAALYLDTGDRAAAERALQIEALSPGWRRSFEKLLAGA